MATRDSTLIRTICIRILRYRGDRRKTVEISHEMAAWLADFLEARHDR